jgi:hypothetical protein
VKAGTQTDRAEDPQAHPPPAPQQIVFYTRQFTITSQDRFQHSDKISVVWIRIGNDLVGCNRIPEGKNDPRKYKKVQKFHVLKCWIFSFEG